MSSSSDDISKKIAEVNQKLGKLKLTHKHEMSDETLHEFCYRYDQFIFGLLHYLKDNTKSHESTTLSVKGEQISKYPALDFENYKTLVSEIRNLTPPTSIEFIFLLEKSFYPISDIKETVTVYFYQDRYEIVYSYGANEELRYVKHYNTHISPDEIRVLRDTIVTCILDKVSAKIEQALS